MYKLRTVGGKRDLIKNWALPDRVFFACGACHMLAYTFLTTYPEQGFKPFWIKPGEGYTGNHVVVVRDQLAFDYHGYSNWSTLMDHMKAKADRWWPGWNATLIELRQEALISKAWSTTYDGLVLREPSQYLYNPLPRAHRFVQRFPSPAHIQST